MTFQRTAEKNSLEIYFFCSAQTVLKHFFWVVMGTTISVTNNCPFTIHVQLNTALNVDQYENSILPNATRVIEVPYAWFKVTAQPALNQNRWDDGKLHWERTKAAGMIIGGLALPATAVVAPLSGVAMEVAIAGVATSATSNVASGAIAFCNSVPDCPEFRYNNNPVVPLRHSKWFYAGDQIIVTLLQTNPSCYEMDAY